jgi:hypothetical protein
LTQYYTSAIRLKGQQITSKFVFSNLNIFLESNMKKEELIVVGKKGHRGTRAVLQLVVRGAMAPQKIL